MQSMDVRSGDMEIIKVPLDYWRSTTTTAPSALLTPGAPAGFDTQQGDQGPKTENGWEVWPEGFYNLITKANAEIQAKSHRDHGKWLFLRRRAR